MVSPVTCGKLKKKNQRDRCSSLHFFLRLEQCLDRGKRAVIFLCGGYGFLKKGTTIIDSRSKKKKLLRRDLFDSSLKERERESRKSWGGTVRANSFLICSNNYRKLNYYKYPYCFLKGFSEERVKCVKTKIGTLLTFSH